MRFPKFTAEQSITRPVITINRNDPDDTIYRSIAQSRMKDGLVPAVDVGCVSGCVGATAYNCLHCDDDVDCWRRCTGSSANTIECLENCF